jgi:SpoVK/Ycf46/Vps4 family AAA+-type ATPase
VAKLYGRILKYLGLLSKGEIILKDPSDFIGTALGKSEEKTNAILEQSKGNVLIIDEAYGLYSGGSVGETVDIYRDAVVTTLVNKAQGEPGDDMCVVMLGYKDEMERMLSSNGGLAGRFQIHDAFYFEDYSNDDLLKLLSLKLKEKNLKAQLQIKVDVITNIIAKQKISPNFNNVRAINNLITRASTNLDSRNSSSKESNSSTLLVYEDFQSAEEKKDDDIKSVKHLLSDLVGMKNVKKCLFEMELIAENAEKTQKNKLKEIPTTFLFLGPPGTGKLNAYMRTQHDH